MGEGGRTRLGSEVDAAYVNLRCEDKPAIHIRFTHRPEADHSVAEKWTLLSMSRAKRLISLFA